MRIAYLTCVYPPYPGGIGVAAAGMAKEMEKRGHEVTIVAPHTMRPWIRWGNAAFMPQILWRLRDFDIVHVLYPFYGTAELVLWLKRRSRAKIVVHHMMDAVEVGVLGAFFRWHARYLMPRLFRAADFVAVLSEDYFRNSDVGKLGLTQVEVVPHGVDTNLFRPRPEKDIPDSRFQIPKVLFVGGLDRAHYFKGVPVLLEACRILKERGVKFKCQIVGDGDMREEYEAQAERVGLLMYRGPASDASEAGPPYIQFVGLVPHDQLSAYYGRAAVCVVPSTERIECFSIVASEAQACGIPVIVTNFPGVRVTIEDGVTGYVVAPADARALADRIQELIEDPACAAAMGKAGRARAERRYSWRVVGDRLEIIYKALCRK